MKKERIIVPNHRKLTLEKGEPGSSCKQEHLNIKNQNKSKVNVEFKQNRLPFSGTQNSFSIDKKTVNCSKKLSHTSSDTKTLASKHEQTRILPRNVSATNSKMRATSSGLFIRRQNQPQTSLKQSEQFLFAAKLQQHASQIIQILKHQLVVLSSNMTTVTIKKDKFIQFITYLIEYCVSRERSKVHRRYFHLNYLRNIFDQIWSIAHQLQHTYDREKLKLITATIKCSYNSKTYHSQIQSAIGEIDHLQKRRINLQSHIQEVRGVTDSIEKECNQKIRLIAVIKEQEEVVRKEYGNELQKLTNLKLQIKKVQDYFIQIKGREQKMFHFVENQQKNKIIKLVSHQYKQIQADIYQFAVYLQSNQLASSLDYQPRPFQHIQTDIAEEMKSLNKTLLQNQISEENKHKKMRDYVLRISEYYKKKDFELTQLNDFKTKCIRQYIQKMKKWLNNWQLKQQYLTNLRQQFGVHSKSLFQLIESLRTNGYCLSCQKAISNLCEQFQIHYQKLQSVFGLGNSFY